MGHTASSVEGYQPRMATFPHGIANIAMDIYINGRILVETADDGLRLGPTFAGGWGLSKLELEIFKGLSEEQTGSLLLEIAKSKPQSTTASKSGKENDGGTSQGASMQAKPDDSPSDSFDDQAGDGNEPGRDNPKGKPDTEYSNEISRSAEHSARIENAAEPQSIEDLRAKLAKELANNGATLTDGMGISDRQLADLMEREGLTEARDAIGLPDSNDDHAYENRRVEHATKMQDVIEEYSTLRANSPMGSSMPGGHIADFGSDYWPKQTSRNRKELSIISELIEQLIGEGSSYSVYDQGENSINEMASEAFGGDTIIPIELASSSEHGVAFFLVDSSGSMSAHKELLADALEGGKECLAHSDDDPGFDKIYFGTADSAIRSNLIEVEPGDEDLLSLDRLDGLGGTDFLNPIHEAVLLAEDEGETLRAIVYVSDMEAYIPAPGELPEDTPPLVFVTNRVCADKISSTDRSRIDAIGVLLVSDDPKHNHVDINELQDSLQVSNGPRP